MFYILVCTLNIIILFQFDIFEGRHCVCLLGAVTLKPLSILYISRRIFWCICSPHKFNRTAIFESICNMLKMLKKNTYKWNKSRISLISPFGCNVRKTVKQDVFATKKMRRHWRFSIIVCFKFQKYLHPKAHLRNYNVLLVQILLKFATNNNRDRCHSFSWSLSLSLYPILRFFKHFILFYGKFILFYGKFILSNIFFLANSSYFTVFQTFTTQTEELMKLDFFLEVIFDYFQYIT